MLNYIMEINCIIDNNIILYPHSWIIESKEYLENILSTTQN